MTDYTGERIHLGLVTANFATSKPEGMKRENCHWYSGEDCHVEKVKTIKKIAHQPICSQLIPRHKISMRIKN